MKINDNINRLLLLLICLGTLLCCLPFAASANESEENIWGDIKWSTDGDTLTISPVNGTAAMPDAESYNKTPWYSYRRDLITVVINEGITHIGDYAFYFLDFDEDVLLEEFWTKYSKEEEQGYYEGLLKSN